MSLDNISIYIPSHIRRSPEYRNKFIIDNIEVTANQYDRLLVPKGLSNSYGYKFKLNDLDVYLESTSSSNSQNVKLIHVRWKPSDFTSFEHSEQILTILDSPINTTLNSLPSNNGIIDHADLNRIDYHLILEADVLDVISGLYISSRSILTGLQDIVDPDVSHTEQEYEAGNFRSFRIGKNNKYIRIYDFNRSRGTNNESNPPRTKIELSLNSKSAIRELMCSSNRQRSTPYLGKYNELREHLQDIADGYTNPFKGILLNEISFHDPAELFKSNQGDNWEIIEDFFSFKRDFDLGLGLNAFRRLNKNRNLLRTHHKYFEINPRIRSQQLTSMYRRSMQNFLRPMNDLQQEQNNALTRCLCIPQPIRNWRMELTE